MKSERLAIGLLFLTAAMFAGNTFMARFAAGTVPPIAMAFWRWALVLLVLLPFVGRDLWKYRAALRVEARDLFLLGATGIGMCAVFPYLAGQSTTATNIALVYTVAPVLIVVGGVVVLGERMGLVQALGVALAALGVTGIVAQGSVTTLLALDLVPGDLWVLGAALTWAAYSLLLKRRPSALPQLVRLWAMAAMGVLAMAPFTLWEGVAQGWPRIDWPTIGIIVFVALVPGLGAFRLHQQATRMLGAARTAIITYLMPLFNTAFAWALLGEVPAIYHYVGGTLVLLGVWLASRSAKP